MMGMKSSLNLSGVMWRMFIVVLFALAYGSCTVKAETFSFEEATIRDIKIAFWENRLTSRQLVEYYIGQIERMNPLLKAVIELHPDALTLADKADYERRSKAPISVNDLHGIPVLVKDNVGIKDLNTTAGSFALLGSVRPRDAGAVTKLKNSGAIILGTANTDEWASFRSTIAPKGWSARGGFAKNPYVLTASPCGSSGGSAVAAAANLVALTIGTEANGSILCPANDNSAVGIKPTVGLVSGDQVVPITPRQFTLGPITRTVADAVYVLDAIVGIDDNDPKTKTASKYIPPEGYKPYLRVDGLQGKKLGIVRNPYLALINKPEVNMAFDKHVATLKQRGAIIKDLLEIPNYGEIFDANKSGEKDLILAEFKVALNAYLQKLVISPVRSLADVITFNKENAIVEMLEEFGQDIMLAAQETNGIGIKELEALDNLARLSINGIEKLMKDNQLDAIVTPGSKFYHVLAIGGYPGINVPAGYDKNGVPFGITFAGLKGSEPTLIQIAYDFEQTTKIRKLPSFKVLKLPTASKLPEPEISF